MSQSVSVINKLKIMNRTILIFIVSLFIGYTIFNPTTYSASNRIKGFGLPKGTLVAPKIPILIKGKVGKKIGEIVNRLRDNIPIEEVTFKIINKKQESKNIIKRPHFMVTIDPDISFNTFASIVAGKGAVLSQLMINLGTLRFVKNPDELAFVIAHELGHFVNGHLDMMVDNWIVDMPDNRWVDNLSNVLGSTRVPVEVEYEADSAAIRYMHAAGYNIGDAIAVMKRFSKQHGDCHVCSHPSTNERLVRMQNLVSSIKYPDQRTNQTNTSLIKTKKPVNKVYALQSSKSYHSKSCSLIEEEETDELIEFDSVKEAEEAGGEPCELCQPSTGS